MLLVLAVGPLLVGAVACGRGGGDDDGGGTAKTDAEVDAGRLGPEDPAAGELVRIGLASDGQTAAFDAVE